MPRTSRCSSCPRRSNQRLAESATTAPLFPDDTSFMRSYTQVTPQERALREAIAPYLCLDQLRALASCRSDLQAALRQQPVPEEIHAMLTLLTALLKPRPEEAIGKPADLAALLPRRRNLGGHRAPADPPAVSTPRPARTTTFPP